MVSSAGEEWVSEQSNFTKSTKSGGAAIIKLVVGVPGIRNSKRLCRHVVPVKHWNFVRNRKPIVKTLKTPCCGRNGIY